MYMTTAAKAAEMGDLLTMLKAASGATDETIADLLDMKRTTFRHKRKGGSELTLSEAVAVSRLFGIPLELLHGRPEAAREWILAHWVELKSLGLSEYFGNSWFDQLELLGVAAA